MVRRFEVYSPSHSLLYNLLLFTVVIVVSNRSLKLSRCLSVCRLSVYQPSEAGSHCCPDWPVTHYVVKAALEPWVPCFSHPSDGSTSCRSIEMLYPLWRKRKHLFHSPTSQPHVATTAFYFCFLRSECKWAQGSLSFLVSFSYLAQSPFSECMLLQVTGFPSDEKVCIAPITSVWFGCEIGWDGGSVPDSGSVQSWAFQEGASTID